MNNFSNFSDSYRHLIKRIFFTDKAVAALENNQYTFIVDRYSNKTIIKAGIEYLFNVKVLKINTCNLPKKKKRTNKNSSVIGKYKKAIVTLSEGDVIKIFPDN